MRRSSVPGPLPTSPLLPQQYNAPDASSPQTAQLPASMLTSPSGAVPGMATGTVDTSLSGTADASWRWLLRPQHHTAPSVAMPHAFTRPTPSVRNRRLPATGVGTVAIVPIGSPVPSWPRKFHPQQYASPSAVSAQAATSLTNSWAKTCPPVTATGIALELTVPSPRWPLELLPQQNAAPSTRNAHE
jgi:hypothetical protein